jgi:cell division septum initiation protein DivIVA
VDTAAQSGLTAGAMADQVGETASQAATLARSTVDQAQQHAGQAVTQASDQATVTMDQAQQQAGHLVAQAKEQADSIIDQAQQQAGQVAEHVRERVAQEAATQMSNASKGLDDLATTLTQLSAQLRGSKLNELAQYTDGVAAQLDAIAAHLHEMTPVELASELQRLVREHPEVFVAGVLGLGLVIGRLVSAARHDQPVSRN